MPYREGGDWFEKSNRKEKEAIRVRVAGGNEKKEDEKGEAINGADTCEETCKVLNFKNTFGSEARGIEIIGSMTR